MAVDLTQLWREHAEALVGFVQRRVGERAAAQDLVSEAFLRLARNTLDHPGAARAWLYRTARHLAVDHLRAARPRETLPEGLAAAEPDRPAEARAELAACLPRLVERLPERYREAVRLAELEGLPQQEVARRQGVSLSGAKSRVQRGRQRLRELVEECCAVECDHRGTVVDYQPRSGC